MSEYKRLTDHDVNKRNKREDFCIFCLFHKDGACDNPDGECGNYRRFCEMRDRLSKLEDKIESGELADTAPYIVEIPSEVPCKYKVIKPTVHKRNVEMCTSKELAERRVTKLNAKTRRKV